MIVAHRSPVNLLVKNTRRMLIMANDVRISENSGQSRPCDERNDGQVLQLHRFFKTGFTAADIAESLVSWDGLMPAEDARRKMDLLNFDVAGIRIGGGMSGWCTREDLNEGQCVDHLRSFFESSIVSAAAPLSAVITRLGGTPRVFVTAFGGIGGIITTADLQKAPVRMWLFGLVTLVEETFTRVLKDRFPGDSWHEMISGARLEVARRLHEERTRRNENLDLADCLQFGDKGLILFKDETIRLEMGFESRTRAKDVVKNLQKLRNNLAHSQDIVAGNLDTIVALAHSMDRVLEVTSV